MMDIIKDKRKKGLYDNEPDQYVGDNLYPLSYFAFRDHRKGNASFVSDTLRRLKSGVHL
jgi:hypothetical protein